MSSSGRSQQDLPLAFVSRITESNLLGAADRAEMRNGRTDVSANDHYELATTGTTVAGRLHAMAEVSIVVADLTRMAAIRDGLVLPGRVMHFASSSLASAVESIRAYRAKVVAVDALFAQTSSGIAFLARLDTMGLPANAIRLVVENDGRWIATARQEPAAVGADRKGGALQQQGVVASPKQPVQSLSSVLTAASFSAASNTRRAPRFLVRNPIEAMVESGRANVVDMSVLGAQIVSLPVLRPNQRIKLGLLDSD